jgi:hypothetical protein
MMQTANTSAGIPAQMQLGLLSPLYLRRLFERMGATYIKLGQVRTCSYFAVYAIINYKMCPSQKKK